jgi:hypothetical protein
MPALVQMREHLNEEMKMALCPLTPLCPLAKLECSDGYRCGYNRGFKAARK